MKNLEERVNDLEIKFSYQDELINELNLMVADQQKYIEELKKVIKELVNNNGEKNIGNTSLKNERPPHY
jgi:SlyX protein